MRIIGIDPGIERTGFAILETKADGQPTVLDHGLITTDKMWSTSERLVQLASDLAEVLRQWRPQAAGLEQIFFSKNVRTAMKVSHARGVIMEVLEEHGVPVHEYNPAHIKIAVTGHGRADKTQIRKMLAVTLGVNVKSDDTADAIACGICLISTNRFA